MIRSTAGATFMTVGLLALVAGPARADELADDLPADPVEETGGAEPRLIEPTRPAAARTAPAADDGFSHKGQLQVSVRTALGMRAIVTYDEDYCGASDNSTSSGNAPVCAGRAPFSLDFELGYGVTRRIDTILELRVGIESDFASTAFTMGGPRMFHLAPGARFFFSDTKRTKLFTTAQVVFDFAGYEDAGGTGRGADFGVRNMNGLWIDLDRAYGFYAYIGETLTVSRWLRFELEAGLGIQGRYP